MSTDQAPHDDEPDPPAGVELTATDLAAGPPRCTFCWCIENKREGRTILEGPHVMADGPMVDAVRVMVTTKHRAYLCSSCVVRFHRAIEAGVWPHGGHAPKWPHPGSHASKLPEHGRKTCSGDVKRSRRRRHAPTARRRRAPGNFVP